MQEYFYNLVGVQYTILVAYVVLVLVTLWAGWKYTSRIEDKGIRRFWRSGVLAAVLAPGFFGAGHGGLVMPALLSAILVFVYGNWERSPLESLMVLFLFAIGPILATWFVVFVVWRSRDWFGPVR